MRNPGNHAETEAKISIVDYLEAKTPENFEEQK